MRQNDCDFSVCCYNASVCCTCVLDRLICPSCVEPSLYAITSVIYLILFISDMALLTVNIYFKLDICYVVVLLKMLLHVSVDFYIFY